MKKLIPIFVFLIGSIAAIARRHRSFHHSHSSEHDIDWLDKISIDFSEVFLFLLFFIVSVSITFLVFKLRMKWEAFKKKNETKNQKGL